MDLRAQIQQHFDGTYAIERELGGGGMSRVFVALEPKLDRRVVIKVLSPDLSQGINVERFEREIRLAASLQQANIVPLLTAGDIGGIPYFTMPYVEGESVRARLNGQPLPIADVMAILRDVSRALSYAHGRGVVHRDIKPDNILLSGGTAVVTDFGIAKALSAARTNDAGATLTQLGTSIGTPAYMAPEQVAGDPNLDHRVDLYSLGCTAFELLAGRPPFVQPTPQKVLAAHLSETVPAVSALRPDIPAPLASLVTQLMAKDPADRPQQAADVLRALDAVTTSGSTLAFSAPGMFGKALVAYVVVAAVVALAAKAAVIAIGVPDWVFPGALIVVGLGLPALLATAWVQRVARRTAIATPTLTPGGTMSVRGPSGTMATMAVKASPHLTWRRTRRGGIIAIGAFVLLVALYMVARATGIGPWGSLVAAGKLNANDRILLADLAAPADDSALVPIVGEAVRAALAQSNSIHLVSEAQMADALAQMKKPRDLRVADPAVVHEVAERTNARATLGGRIARLGAGYAVSLDLTGSDGATLASYQATANGSQDLLKVVDELTRKLRGKVGESLKQVRASIPLEQATTTSLDALKAYSAAAHANDIEQDYPRAVQLARQAVALDTTFALAWRKLAVALANSGVAQSSIDSALERAARFSDKLPDRERYLALGAYYRNSAVGADRAKAVESYIKAYAADSNGTTAVNELMLVYRDRHQWDSAVRYSRRMAQLQPNSATAARIPVSLALAGNTAEAVRIVDSLKFTHDDSLAYTVAMALSDVDLARGFPDSVRELGRIWSKRPDPLHQMNGAVAIGAIAYAAGQLRAGDSALLVASRLDAAGGGPAALPQLLHAGSDGLVRGKTPEALRDLDSTVASPAWQQMSEVDRPSAYVAYLYAYLGRPDRARIFLTEFQQHSPAAKAPDSREVVATIEGMIALAEHRNDDALRSFHAAATGDDGYAALCEACTDVDLGRAFDAAGQPDSAIAAFEAFSIIPAGRRVNSMILGLVSDWEFQAGVERRLGELYEAKNDPKDALRHYTAFVDAWKNADPDLQPQVAAVRARIAALSRAVH